MKTILLATAAVWLAASPASAYVTPFSPTAPWNVPVASLSVDPSSAALVRDLWCGNGCSKRDGAENLNLTDGYFSFPVYDASTTTKTCLVRVRTGWSTNIGGKSIPCNAAWRPSGGVNWPMTDAQGNTGSDRDAQVIILDPATGREWDLWRYDYQNGVVTISNGNLVPGSYWTSANGYPPSRGAGIEYYAMLPTPDEVRAGAVRHALPLSLPNESASFVPPATKSDGPWGLADIPAGTRYALAVSDTDVALWLNALPGCIGATGKTSLRVLVTALRDYGMIVTDHADAAQVQLADVANPATKTAWAGLGLATQTCSNGKEYPRDALDGLLREDRLVALTP